MAEVGKPAETETIFITDAPPNIQISIRSVVADYERLKLSVIDTGGALSHFRAWRQHIFSHKSPWPSDSETPSLKFAAFAEFPFQKPRNPTGRQFADIANVYESGHLIADPQLLYAEWFDADVSALKDFRILPLMAGDKGQNKRKDSYNNCCDSENFIVGWFDVSISEPTQIDPNRREEFRKHGIDLTIIIGLFAALFASLSWWIS